MSGPVGALALALAALLLPGASGAQSIAAASIPDESSTRAERTLAFLFHSGDGPTVVHLDATAIDSVGTAMSDRNLAVMAAVDEEYRRGAYGEPESDEARENALDAYMYHSETAFDFFLALALQDSVIYSTSEADLKEAFTTRFRNPGLYPIVNLVDARAGFGKFGLQFEVEDPTPRQIQVARDKMKAWTEEIEWEGERFRVVNIDMKTISNDRVHVVYRRFSCGAVRAYDTEQDGVPIRVASLEDLSGQYVRKFGFHVPAAMVVWKAKVDGLVPPPPSGRFLGSAVYFPSLTLELPWFLPDLGFEDLRRFDFPEPILTMDAVRGLQEHPRDWLRIGDDLRISSAEGEGPIPTFIASRFPDR